MREAGTLLSAVALSAIWSAQASAQVSIPLPGRPAPTPAAPGTPGAPPTSVPLPTVGQPHVPLGSHGRPDINPYERDIDMTVPLTYRNRNLGDVPVRLTFDDQFFVDTATFVRLITPLLNAEALAAVTSRLRERRTFTADDLAASGVSLEYDPSSLSVVVLRIDASQRAMERLFAPPADDRDNIDLQPAHFSGYLNINVLESYFWNNGGNLAKPTVALNGAIRLGRIVFEGDGQFGESLGFNSKGYRFERNYARLVYDQPEDFRRWFLGDLTPEIRGQQTYVQIGGIGVLRQRRRFNDFRAAVLQGNRQLILQQQATVSVYRNGVLYRELRLDAGSYDFSSLPLLTGSNDVQIIVRNNGGQVQTLNYQSYLDPIDLDPGDHEYGAYIGPTSRRFGQSPSYGGPVAFSGFYRKAFLNAPAFGVGLQASRDVQTLTGQTQFVIGNGSRILIDGGLSNSRAVNQGFSAGVGFDQLIDRGGLIDTFTIRADYLSKHFASLGDPTALNTTAWSINGQYSRSVNLSLTLLLTGSYIRSRSQGDSYRVGAQAYYRLDQRWSVRAGVDYARYPTSFARGDGLGFNIALVFQPDYRRRAEARYESNTNTGEISYTQSSLNQIGSVGFGAVATRQDTSVQAQAFADYTGNRFDATISHASFGPNLSSFGQANVTTVRFGTSLAFADGAFGVGRRINDSFAILYPHSNLGNRRVVAGQSLAQNNYISRSGTLGGAVNGFLTSYVTQSVQYDVEDPPTGYDVGPGVVRVRPTYHSGYALRIGTDAFVSAVGRLLQPGGQPVSLAGGRVVLLGEPAGDPVPFFTNSVGRFAIASLLPGRRYRVEIYGNSSTFEFEVPRDTSGLVDLATVSLPPPAN